MIMNREPYDSQKVSYSLNQDGLARQIKEGIRPFNSQTVLRTHTRQYLSLIHLLSEKAFNGVSKEEAINFVNQSTEDDLIYYLSNTAYINVKKSNGVNVSEKSNLKAYAKKGIDILKEQIRFCNPSII